MESLMKPVTESGDTSATRSSRRSVDVSPLERVLDEIRAGAENALYGAGPDEAEELFAKHVASLVEGAGLPVLQTMHYRWFLRELARLWRTRKGRDLAFHLELCIRKWVGLGLEPKTLQFLVCEVLRASEGAELTTKTPSHEESRRMPAESADAQARISHPPITPITEDSSSSVRDPNLRESVESVDSPPAPSSAESATSASSAVLPSRTTQSAESAKSADVRSGTSGSLLRSTGKLDLNI